MKRPLILISNDDGYQAKGLRSLVDMVRHLGDVIVCAPDGPRSGYACAFSATTPLMLTLREKYYNQPISHNGWEEPEVGSVEIWSCNGTPVDCVKMALHEIVPRRPDIVIGGINHGDNASVNTHYSGTMGVVMEGCMKHIPSVAYSLCDYRADADFNPMRPYVERFTAQILANGLPKGVCLNINFPVLEASSAGIANPLEQREERDYQGVKVCRMGFGSWQNEVTKCHHPRGYDYWWMVGHYHDDEPEATDTDRWALDHGYVAITPTRMDVTAYEAFESLQQFV